MILYVFQLVFLLFLVGFLVQGTSAAHHPHTKKNTPHGLGAHFINMEAQEARTHTDVKVLWDELNNSDVDEAMRKIKEERPELKVVKVKKGSMVTMDYNLQRVRVYYDPDTGKVTSSPKAG